MIENFIRKACTHILFWGFLFILLAPWFARADWSGHNYWVTSGTKRVIACAIEPSATGYEFQARRMETGKTFTWRTINPQLEVAWKTPGHYVIYARWVKSINGVTTFSEWKNSLEHNSSLVLVGGTWTSSAWVIIVPTAY